MEEGRRGERKEVLKGGSGVERQDERGEHGCCRQVSRPRSKPPLSSFSDELSDKMSVVRLSPGSSEIDSRSFRMPLGLARDGRRIRATGRARVSYAAGRSGSSWALRVRAGARVRRGRRRWSMCISSMARRRSACSRGGCWLWSPRDS